jgi:hypothetical protein|nr:hypothetical protein [Kofleriaceae bacterium]
MGTFAGSDIVMPPDSCAGGSFDYAGSIAASFPGDLIQALNEHNNSELVGDATWICEANVSSQGNGSNCLLEGGAVNSNVSAHATSDQELMLLSTGVNLDPASERIDGSAVATNDVVIMCVVNDQSPASITASCVGTYLSGTLMMAKMK